MKQELRGRLWAAGSRRFFERAGISEGNLVEWAAGISTEGAQEIQKGKVSRFQEEG
jgi:transketolase C-terminal domain/subunit